MLFWSIFGAILFNSIELCCFQACYSEAWDNNEWLEEQNCKRGLNTSFKSAFCSIWHVFLIRLVILSVQARGNAILQASLERRKQALHERRLALEQDVIIFSLSHVAFSFQCFTCFVSLLLFTLNVKIVVRNLVLCTMNILFLHQ